MRERLPTPQDDPDAAVSADVLDWLHATQWFGMKLGLDSMRRLLRRLDQPDEGLSFLHVAGTNGKGSTCAFTERLLRHSGYKTGLFTSPHLVDFRERIQVNGEWIPEASLRVHLERIRTLVDRWKPHPTFFEITFAAALLHFQEVACERIVVEVGMGGRLDSTNVIHPLACAILPVDYDHKRFLGDDLASIAREKAGIIKQEVPLVLARQRPAARTAIRRVARELKAPVTEITEPWPEPVGLAGDFQRWNAATAVKLLEVSGHPLTIEETRHALNHTTWPARFQRLDNERLIIDGAHNPAAARLLTSEWQRLYPGEKAVILFSGMKDKEWQRTLELLSPIAAEWIFTQLKPMRSLTADDLEKTAAELEKQGVKARVIANPADAFHELQRTAAKEKKRALVAGSLYLAGEILALREGGSFRPSEQ